jgi:hypothetical protein
VPTHELYAAILEVACRQAKQRSAASLHDDTVVEISTDAGGRVCVLLKDGEWAKVTEWRERLAPLAARNFLMADEAAQELRFVPR